MRLALAFTTLLASACAANAQVVQDRYGPPRAAPLMTASLTPYEGRTLRWSGRPHPASEPAPALQPPPAPQAALPQAALPQIRYAPIRHMPAPTEPPRGPTAVAGVQARAAAPMQTAPAAQPRTGAAPPRFYSLHRQYGMTPDVIPPQSAAPRYVLIGPADEPAKKAEAADEAGLADDGPST